VHVLVVTTVHHPEDARIRHRQIASLLDAGHHVTYVAPAGDITPEPDRLERVVVPRAQGRARLPSLRAAHRALRECAPSADIVLLHDPELLVPAWRMRRPVVVWDVHEDTPASLDDKRWLPRWLRPAAAAGVRAVEHRAERRFRILLAEDGYRARFAQPHPVVPNDTWVPPSVAPPGDERVVYLGRISAGRGADELLALADHLPAGTRLELIGPCDAEVEPRVRAADASGEVVWHGLVPNPVALELLDGALAGVSLLRDRANYQHSRPTKVIEYAAHGVPIITTPNAVAADFVHRFDCGSVVPFESPRAAADAVTRLRADGDLRRGCGSRGHAAARAHFDWAVSGTRFVATLEEWAAAGAVGAAAPTR
jgi:glycosyltransferase involved in cell wall biosynthesis